MSEACANKCRMPAPPCSGATHAHHRSRERGQGGARLRRFARGARGAAARRGWWCRARLTPATIASELARTGLVMGAARRALRGPSEEMARRARPRNHTHRRARARAGARGAASRRRSGRRSSAGTCASSRRLVGELERMHVTPARVRRALSVVGAQRSPCGAHAASVGELFSRYQRLLAELGLHGRGLLAARTLDALRGSPARWREAGAGRTAVFFYGFDDLTALELDAIETLARVVDAPVTVALTYEAGRVAFADRAAAFQMLLPWARKHVVVAPATRYYAALAGRALGHLERRLFEPERGAHDAGARSTRAGREGARRGRRARRAGAGGGGDQGAPRQRHARRMRSRSCTARRRRSRRRSPMCSARTACPSRCASAGARAERARARAARAAALRAAGGGGAASCCAGCARPAWCGARSSSTARAAAWRSPVRAPPRRRGASGSRSAGRWTALERLLGAADARPAALIECVERELWRPLLQATPAAGARALGARARRGERFP